MGDHRLLADRSGTDGGRIVRRGRRIATRDERTRWVAVLKFGNSTGIGASPDRIDVAPVDPLRTTTVAHGPMTTTPRLVDDPVLPTYSTIFRIRACSEDGGGGAILSGRFRRGHGHVGCAFNGG
jgi:hypothetical protein